MKTYIVTVNYPELEFEAESEEHAIEQAVAAILTNWDVRKCLTVQAEDEREYLKALEERAKE